jgi:6-hydroxynicotinate 3-monooxygenase
MRGIEDEEADKANSLRIRQLMDKPRIGIVGAGLGGITAAIMLQRAGFPVRIYEQAPEIARIGAGIQLGANVMRVMRALGLAEALYGIGLVPDHYQSREWDTGRVLFDVPVRDWAAAYGMPNLIMHRGDLQAIMAAALQPGTVVFGKHLLDVQVQAGGAKLVFADGSVAAADIVVGADGVDSRVRAVMHGPEKPIYTGVVAYRAIFPTALLGVDRLDCDMSKWWSDERHPAAEDRHFIIYHLTQRRDEVYFVTGSPEPHWEEGVASVPAEIDEIRECYEGFHPDVLRVIEACPQASKWPLLTRLPIQGWSDGPVVLLGDACHPMRPHMGQGANMAIEDGVVLARCLSASDGDPAVAFPLYEATRFARATRVQTESNVNIWLKYPTDPSWVFAYDPLGVPLGRAPQTKPHAMEPV